MIKITSERLMFRELSKEDVSERYVAWLNDPEINRFLETRFSDQTLESCEKFVSDMNNDPASFLFGIFNKETAEHIGNIKLDFINSHHGKGQLSLFVGEKSYWCKGVATESVRNITKWGFEELRLEKIEAGCYDTNLGSLRAFIKAGYSVEGFLRNSFLFEETRIGCFLLGMTCNDKFE